MQIAFLGALKIEVNCFRHGRYIEDNRFLQGNEQFILIRESLIDLGNSTRRRGMGYSNLQNVT